MPEAGLTSGLGESRAEFIRKQGTDSHVAVAGCGAITALGSGVDTLRAALRSNASGLRPSVRFDHPRYQSKMVGATPHSDALGDDPAWELASGALAEAREQAQEVLQGIAVERIGLVLSTTKANIEALERLMDHRPCSEASRRHLRGDLLAADLAAAHRAGGPVQCVSVACVSGLVAIHQGTRLIQRGAADAVLVVGVDHLSSFVVAGFSALKALDPNGCRPFDRNRCGLSPGEAGAAMVLVRNDLLGGLRSGPGNNGSTSPCRVSIVGWGSSNDANHMTGPARDGAGLAQAARTALKSAGLQPADIDYINAHGTGTPYNDAMESQALRSIFADSCPPVSASKGMLGHTLGAAGVAETMICILAMQDMILPGTPRLSAAADETPSSLIHEPRPAAKLDYVMKLNTGFGGINGALILGRT